MDVRLLLEPGQTGHSQLSGGLTYDGTQVLGDPE